MNIYNDVFVYSDKYKNLSNEEIIEIFNQEWDKRINYVLRFNKNKDTTLKLLSNKRYDEYIKLLTDLGIIYPFSEDLLERMQNVCVNFKSLKDHFSDWTTRGKCYSMSVALSLLFDNCNLYKGIVHFPLVNVEHQWLEHDNKVYDTTLHLVFPKEYYYGIYKPSDIKKLTQDEIEQIMNNPLNIIRKKEQKNK